MPAGNLAAWDLDASQFDAVSPAERRAFLVRFAVLAPSGHNSQPWKFHLESDAVTVSPDLSRDLPESDRNRRQLYLSLACAAENLCLAADYYGYRTTVELTEVEDLTAFRVRLEGEPRPAAERRADHPALAITKRHANRNKYEARPPEPAFLEWVRGLTGAGLEIHLIQDDPVKAQVAGVVSDALVEAMDLDSFRLELSHYIRHNVTRAYTGMPMSGFGMPTPLSFLAPALLRRVNVNRASRRQDLALLTDHTPMFVVITTSEDGPGAWLAAGRAFERIAVEAARRGLSTAPMAAAIQIGENYRRLQELLKTSDRPQMFFRLGYAARPTPLTPRLPSDLVIVR